MAKANCEVLDVCLQEWEGEHSALLPNCRPVSTETSRNFIGTRAGIQDNLTFLLTPHLPVTLKVLLMPKDHTSAMLWDACLGLCPRTESFG